MFRSLGFVPFFDVENILDESSVVTILFDCKSFSRFHS